MQSKTKVKCENKSWSIIFVGNLISFYLNNEIIIFKKSQVLVKILLDHKKRVQEIHKFCHSLYMENLMHAFAFCL